MEYNKVKNANYILSNSSYVVKNAEKYKNKWNDFFGNKILLILNLVWVEAILLLIWL